MLPDFHISEQMYVLAGCCPSYTGLGGGGGGGGVGVGSSIGKRHSSSGEKKKIGEGTDKPDAVCLTDFVGKLICCCF